jgi:MYXO-CTERM domain-containing protein
MKETWIKALASALLGAVCVVAQAGAIATDAAPGWFDADSGVRILRITEHGIVGNVTLSIDFAKCNDPGVGEDGQCIDNTGSFDNEIYFRLSSPTGATISLVDPWTYSGSSVGAGRVTVRFDDAAGWQVGSLDFNNGNVMAGSFRPIEALAGLKGRDMFGDWTLLVGDAGYGDPLQYFAARMEVTSSGPVDVAEPGMVAVMGAGLLGLGAALRLRRRRYELGFPPARGRR